MWELRSCARGSNELGDALRESLATHKSVWVVRAKDALVACECFTKEGRGCCGIGLRQ